MSCSIQVGALDVGVESQTQLVAMIHTRCNSLRFGPRECMTTPRSQPLIIPMQQTALPIDLCCIRGHSSPLRDLLL